MKTNPDDSTNSIVMDLANDPRLEQGGLTKREYFAAMAMQGLLAQTPSAIGAKLLCKESVVCADALIAALNEGKE